MTALPDVLTDPDVEVVDLRTTADPDAFERRHETVATARNRAVAAAVSDDDGRLLLARAGDAWRLPGTAVGSVKDFVGELREAVRTAYGLTLAAERPRWVYRQTVERDGVGAPLYYVVCEADVAGFAAGDDAALRWFEEPPVELVNPTVVRDRFAGRAAGRT